MSTAGVERARRAAPRAATCTALGALLCSALACGEPSGRASPPAPEGPARNVLLVSVDTLRADGLGTYGGPAWGSPEAATPVLDELAERSLVFERAYSPATLTHPALSSMLTGLFPLRHGVGGQDGALFANVVPLAEVLRARGVETASFVANLCKLQEVEHTVFSTGWDTSFCGLDLAIEQHLWDEAVVDAALAWLDEHPPGSARPWFAWVHLMDPHAEHRPPPSQWDYAARPVQEKEAQYQAFAADEEARAMPSDERLRELRELYAAEIRGVDALLGRLFAALDARPDRDRTALLFTADHGEELFETWSRYDHGMSLSEGVLWIPLFVQAPGVAPGRSQALVELQQVCPTVLELLGVDPPYALDAPSLLAAEPSRGYALSAFSNVALTARDATHRYWLRKSDQPYERPPDIAPWRADAPWFREKECLARYPAPARTAVEWLAPSDAPALVAPLRKAVTDYLSHLGPQREATRVHDPELREQLDELGYVDGE